VIDDEQGIRTLLDTLLSWKGYEVVLASSGQKGLVLFRREHPDAVVLDLKMPVMDGLTCGTPSNGRLCTKGKEMFLPALG
jgi:CheY-like chemotaxis protein